MHDDTAFLRALAEQPGDHDTLLVYADWLDDHDLAPRAEFLRLQHRILGMNHRQRNLVPLSRQLLALGQSLPKRWIERVSVPHLEGTCWAGRERGGTFYVFRFLPKGVLNYTSPTGTYQNATWKQIGNHVTMEMNRHYADYEGFVAADRIRGTARNVVDAEWRWSVTRTTDPKYTDLGEPDTTVYADHPRPRRRRRSRE